MQQTLRQPFKRHTGGHCARAVCAGVRAVGIENLHAKNAASPYGIYESSYQNRSNHLLLDDTAEQIQVQLKSDHQHSSLSLGHITRIEDRAGRQEHRGEGFELRTDGHGALADHPG